jgi:hypothetical protein
MSFAPNTHGLGGSLMYQVDQTGGQAEKVQTLVSGSLSYKSGGLYAGVACEAMSRGFASDTWTDTSGGSDVVRAAYGNGASGIRCGERSAITLCRRRG